MVSQHGGTISNVIHQRLDVLVASSQALQKNTQAIRKAAKLGVPTVLPSFVNQSVAAGSLCDLGPHLPQAAATLDAPGTAAKTRFASLIELGLTPGDQIDVRVEMSEGEPVVWWPAVIGDPIRGALPHTHELTYLPLSSHGYDSATPSKARLREAELLDTLEGESREWRRAPSDFCISCPLVGRMASPGLGEKERSVAPHVGHMMSQEHLPLTSKNSIKQLRRSARGCFVKRRPILRCLVSALFDL